MSVRRFRRELYKSARWLGDLEAASKGSSAYARRRGRKMVYRGTGRLGRAICRALGL